MTALFPLTIVALLLTWQLWDRKPRELLAVLAVDLLVLVAYAAGWLPARDLRPAFLVGGFGLALGLFPIQGRLARELADLNAEARNLLIEVVDRMREAHPEGLPEDTPRLTHALLNAAPDEVTRTTGVILPEAWHAEAADWSRRYGQVAAVFRLLAAGLLVSGLGFVGLMLAMAFRG